MDLPSVLILINADQFIHDLLCCSYEYNWCLCRLIGIIKIIETLFNEDAYLTISVGYNSLDIWPVPTIGSVTGSSVYRQG